MDFIKLRFTKRKVVLEWLGEEDAQHDNRYDEHGKKGVAPPHPDFISVADNIVPVLANKFGLGAGKYRFKSADFYINDDSEAIAVKAVKINTEGQEVELSFPRLRVEDELVELVSNLYDEMELYLDGKSAQGTFDFEGEEDEDDEDDDEDVDGEEDEMELPVMKAV